jgi:hypothetical protein
MEPFFVKADMHGMYYMLLAELDNLNQVRNWMPPFVKTDIEQIL